MKEPKTHQEGMNLQQLSAYVGISYATAFRLSNEPGFPCVRFGKRKIFPRKLVDEWLREQAKKAGR